MMSKGIRVFTSPITNTIYAGRLNKEGASWAAGKQDVTGEACAAVAVHVLAREQPVIVTGNGEPLYEITVRDLSK